MTLFVASFLLGLPATTANFDRAVVERVVENLACIMVAPWYIVVTSEPALHSNEAFGLTGESCLPNRGRIQWSQVLAPVISRETTVWDSTTISQWSQASRSS